MTKPLYDGIIGFFPDRYLTIAFDTNGNLLEIIYNLENDATIRVFHAMKCRKGYIDMLRTLKLRGDYGKNDR